VVKPFRVSDLIETLEDVLAKREAAAEPVV
jgi:hypothetical protein